MYPSNGIHKYALMNCSINTAYVCSSIYLLFRCAFSTSNVNNWELADLKPQNIPDVVSGTCSILFFFVSIIFASLCHACLVSGFG